MPEPEDVEEEDNEEEDNDDSPVKDTVFGNSTPHANKSKNQHRQFRFVKHVSKRYVGFKKKKLVHLVVRQLVIHSFQT